MEMRRRGRRGLRGGRYQDGSGLFPPWAETAQDHVVVAGRRGWSGSFEVGGGRPRISAVDGRSELGCLPDIRIGGRFLFGGCPDDGGGREGALPKAGLDIGSDSG